jgi:isoleucyl-tRNA synthetase
MPFPEVDEAALDADLSFAMDQAIHVVSSALALRKSKDIRVRQPLSRLVVVPADATTRSAIERFEDVIAAEINVKAIELRDDAEALVRHEAKPDFGRLGKRFGKKTQAVAQAIRAMDPDELRAAQKEGRDVMVSVDGEQEAIQSDEFSLVEVVPEGLAASETAAGTLAIDLVVTDELRIEGLARDVVRHVQQLRKEKDLEMEDRIVLRYEVEGDDLSRAFVDWDDYIRAETLASEMSADTGLLGGPAKQVKLGAHRLAIDLERA